MRVFLRTFHFAEILREGFRDAAGKYLTDQDFTGVWVSDRPLDITEGANGDVLLVLDVPDEIFAMYEWVEEGKPYREALIPAKFLNSLNPPKIRSVEEVL